MTIHFEHLWQQGEALSYLSKSIFDTEADEIDGAQSLIKRHLNLLQKDSADMREYHMGIILYNLCAMSKLLSINTYAALQKTITDVRSEQLDKLK